MMTFNKAYDGKKTKYINMTLKHYSLVLTLALFCQTVSLSQNDDNASTTTENRFRFAAKGGINFSNNLGDVDSRETFLLDFHIGGVVKIPTPLPFDIQIEPQYSRVGSRLGGKTRRRFSFLDLPLLGTITTFNEFSIEAGPKLGITLDQKQRLNALDGELNKVDRLKAVTGGLVAGATYNFKDKLFSQFRVNYTFGDIIRDDAGDNEGTSILLFQLSIGYWLN